MLCRTPPRRPGGCDLTVSNGWLRDGRPEEWFGNAGMEITTPAPGTFLLRCSPGGSFSRAPDFDALRVELHIVPVGQPAPRWSQQPTGR